MGLDRALGEAFYVLGQHLFLVAVGCMPGGEQGLVSLRTTPHPGTPPLLLPRGAAAAYNPERPLPWLSPGAPPPSGGWGHSPAGHPKMASWNS